MRGNEWAPLYLIVVLAIAAVLLVTFVKPLFQQASNTATQNTQAANTAAKSILIGIGLPAAMARSKKRLTPFPKQTPAWTFDASRPNAEHAHTVSA